MSFPERLPNYRALPGVMKLTSNAPIGKSAFSQGAFAEMYAPPIGVGANEEHAPADDARAHSESRAWRNRIFRS
ncbi:hypothetical protein [Sphingomonas sp. Root710]|uniref:hypothetical protein n=1 Tax=Sphingomonas sp. Root710 TaxID=1736594 RepID=UPI00138F1BA2|nr:hypothetical protein [Sphingomonas sp. Root710]